MSDTLTLKILIFSYGMFWGLAMPLTCTYIVAMARRYGWSLRMARQSLKGFLWGAVLFLILSMSICGATFLITEVPDSGDVAVIADYLFKHRVQNAGAFGTITGILLGLFSFAFVLFRNRKR